jgi:hypothetical protein
MADYFIGVTRIEVVDEVSSTQRNFRFVMFTSVSISEVEGFRDTNIYDIVINKGPEVYLYDGDRKAIGLMYEVEVFVKPVPCKFTTVKMAFDHEVKDIRFGYYELKDTVNSANNIMAVINPAQSIDEYFEMMLLIHNNNSEDVVFERMEFVEPSYHLNMRPVIKPLAKDRQTILAYNIKSYSNITIQLPKNVFYAHGLINLIFKNDLKQMTLATDYLIDDLPDYYVLKEKGIGVDSLIIN